MRRCANCSTTVFCGGAAEVDRARALGAAFVASRRAALDALPFDDAVATLAALCVRTVAGAIRRYAPHAARTIAARRYANVALLAGLRAALPGWRSETTSVRHRSDAKETLAFALLGYETLREASGGSCRA